MARISVTKCILHALGAWVVQIMRAHDICLYIYNYIYIFIYMHTYILIKTPHFRAYQIFQLTFRRIDLWLDLPGRALPIPRLSDRGHSQCHGRTGATCAQRRAGVAAERGGASRAKMLGKSCI
jgi:hypothetical protein